jgi:hypothetical protein
LERAQYQAERVERRYQSVEPENRLVARTENPTMRKLDATGSGPHVGSPSPNWRR